MSVSEVKRDAAVTPPPGIYRNVDFDDYLAWDCVSNSRLKLCGRSMAHFKHGYPSGDKAAFRFGSLVHCGRLEPAAVAERYAVMPNFKLDPQNTDTKGKRSYGCTKWVKEREEQWRAENPERTEVTQTEYDQMAGLVGSLASNAAAMDVLGGAGDTEVSIIWKDDDTGLLCKARYDKLQSTRRRFADLKTCMDPLKFERSIIDYGYHVQCAFYQRGYYVLTGDLLEPWLVAVEKSEPWGSRAAPISEELLTEGWEQAQAWLACVADAKDSGKYPGYDNPEEWDGPEWYRRRRENEPLELVIGGEKVIL